MKIPAYTVLIYTTILEYIPAHLHQMTELAKFKCDLSDFLITIPDTPPVVGYVGVNSNSLLDWKLNKADTELQGWSIRIAE